MCGGEKRRNTRALARLAWQAARVHDVRVERFVKIGSSPCALARLAWQGRRRACTTYASNGYSIPLAGVHLRLGEQVSGTSAFDVLHREKATIRFLGSALRDCSLFVRDGSSSSSLACCVPS
uniref:Uncharacterized protein n=1 Tax=Oryza sativa subsp. japonica TaxID=39947 RepID=Q69MD3_ORYSJ|nr:hypothetical protein [Oryza sativa Japonica Group]